VLLILATTILAIALPSEARMRQLTRPPLSEEPNDTRIEAEPRPATN
jgi:hypothetical protein